MKSIRENWYDLIKIVLKNGEIHEKDDGDILQEHLINHCMIYNPLKQFGNQNINSKIFLDMLGGGVFDIPEYPIKGKALLEYVTAFDDIEQIQNINPDGTKKFVYTYPERIQSIKLCSHDNENMHFYNQYEIIKNRLIEHSGSNRAVATLYSAGLDETEQHIPCLNWIQATIRNNELLLHVMFRSNDCYGAWVSNMFFISYIGIKLTEELQSYYPSLIFKGISYNSTSLHIYKNDIEQAKRILDNIISKEM